MIEDAEFTAGIDSLALGQLFRRRWVKGDALDSSREPPPWSTNRPAALSRRRGTVPLPPITNHQSLFTLPHTRVGM